MSQGSQSKGGIGSHQIDEINNLSVMSGLKEIDEQIVRQVLQSGNKNGVDEVTQSQPNNRHSPIRSANLRMESLKL